MAEDSTLGAQFLAALVEPLRSAYAETDATDILTDAADAARARFEALPDLGPQFATHVAQRIDHVAGQPAVALTALCLQDLYLACACMIDANAIATFTAEYGPQLDMLRARLRSPVDADEFRQVMLERLFVGDASQPPRIASYRGRGNLRAWLRVVGTRWLLDRARAKDIRPIQDDKLDERISDAMDSPELALIKSRYNTDFKRLFATAAQQLTARQRNVIRLRYVRGLAVDEIARAYGLHRVTMSRTLSGARQALMDNVRREFVASHKDLTGSDELKGVIALISSQLELSLDRILASSPPEN